jgi:hypothetical protein
MNQFCLFVILQKNKPISFEIEKERLVLVDFMPIANIFSLIYSKWSIETGFYMLDLLD